MCSYSLMSVPNTIFVERRSSAGFMLDGRSVSGSLLRFVPLRSADEYRLGSVMSHASRPSPQARRRRRNV